MGYALRAMEPDDVPVVAAIDRLSFPTPWPSAAFRRELRRDNARYYVLLRPQEEQRSDGDLRWTDRLRHLFSAVRRSRIIGYVGFRLEGDAGHITTIAVQPDWRGKGFGELLLWVAMDRIVDGGLDRGTLEMRPSNQVALQLYRKYGFEVKRRRPAYYQDGDDAWVMEVSVDHPGYRQFLDRRCEALRRRFRRHHIEFGQIVTGSETGVERGLEAGLETGP